MTPDLNNVPVLPANADRLFTALNDPNIDLTHLAEYLEKYPTIVGRLLTLANSAWSGAAVPVLDLDAACARLGLQVVRNTGIALMVASNFDARSCPAFSASRYWRQAFATGELMALYADRGGGDFTGDQLRPMGLLRNVGLLWLAHNMPVETDTVLAELGVCGMHRLDEHTQRHCGVSARTASVAVVQKWGLPIAVVTTIRGDPAAAPSTVAPVLKTMDVCERIGAALLQDDQAILQDALANDVTSVDDEPDVRAVYERAKRLAEELF